MSERKVNRPLFEIADEIKGGYRNGSTLDGSWVPRILNYRVPVRGSDVVAHLGLRTRTGEWLYSLWSGEGPAEHCIATGTLGAVLMDITPDQAARIAFLLEVDYGGK